MADLKTGKALLLEIILYPAAAQKHSEISEVRGPFFCIYHLLLDPALPSKSRVKFKLNRFKWRRLVYFRSRDVSFES